MRFMSSTIINSSSSSITVTLLVKSMSLFNPCGSFTDSEVIGQVKSANVSTSTSYRL